VPVLVADGDAQSRALIAELLERIGSRPYEAASGPDALALAESVQPALVILDVALPGISGYEVCHELRDRFGDTMSVVFVSSARGEPLDRVAGLLIGADDYIVKPFHPDELLVRVRALLRRRDGDRNGREETREDGDSPLATLTMREREVLALLAQGRNQGEIALELVISPEDRRDAHPARAREARRSQPRTGGRRRAPRGARGGPCQRARTRLRLAYS
jgi:DNA-binding response OmpR family regulator